MNVHNSGLGYNYLHSLVPEVGDPLRIFPLDAEKLHQHGHQKKNYSTVTKTQANIPFKAL